MSVVVVSQLVFVRAAKAPSRPATLARRAPRSKPTAARSVSGETYCNLQVIVFLLSKLCFFARLEVIECPKRKFYPRPDPQNNVF